MFLRWKLLSLLVALSILASGCAAALIGVAAAGGATYVYVRGETRTRYSHDLPTVFNAAVAVLEQDLKVPITSRAYDATVGHIHARRADDNEIKVGLKLEGGNVTRIAVRVGIVGDRPWNEIFLDKLTTRLASRL